MRLGNADNWLGYIASFVAIMIASGPAQAQMTENTVNVGARAASFLQPRLSGAVTAAIVYQPGHEASEREARAIERELAGGLAIGALRLAPRRVAANALDGLAGARIAFVTRGTNSRQIAAATAARSIVTITSDPACVRAGHCAVAVQSSPKIQIIVSRAACGAAGIRFSAAFLMLVREI